MFIIQSLLGLAVAASPPASDPVANLQAVCELPKLELVEESVKRTVVSATRSEKKAQEALAAATTAVNDPSLTPQQRQAAEQAKARAEEEALQAAKFLREATHDENVLISGTNTDSLNELCEAAPWNSEPYLKRRHDIRTLPPIILGNLNLNICEQTADARAVLDHYEIKTDPNVANFEASCNISSGSPLLAAAALPLIQGLGDVIQSRGKEEIYDYAVDQFGSRLCDGFPETGEPPVDSPAYFLQQTCRVLYPNGESNGAATLSTIRNVRIRGAIQEDLAVLPGRLLAPRNGSNESHQWVASVLTEALGTVLAGRDKSAIDPEEVATEWRDRTESLWRKRNLAACPLEKRECTALLLLEIFAGSANFGTSEIDIGASSEKGLRNYCKTYTKYETEDCITKYQDIYLSTIHERAIRVAKSGHKLQKVAERIQRATDTGASHEEVSERFHPELRKTLRSVLLASSTDLLWEAGTDQGNLGEAVMTVSAATASGDYGDLLEAAVLYLSRNLDACASTPVQAQSQSQVQRKDKRKVKRCNRETEKAVSLLAFAADLAGADTREDAARVIEDAASPRGTWRMKYGRGSPTLTVNGFLGYVAGGQTRFNRVNDSEGNIASPNAAAFRVATPVGFDLTLGTLWTRAHVGFFFPLLDPLALSTVDDEGNSASANIGSVLSPGAAVRVGILRSPFVLAFGATYHPFLEAGDACNDNACWRGALQYTAGVEVDIPLVVIR